MSLILNILVNSKTNSKIKNGSEYAHDQDFKTVLDFDIWKRNDWDIQGKLQHIILALVKVSKLKLRDCRLWLLQGDLSTMITHLHLKSKLKKNPSFISQSVDKNGFCWHSCADSLPSLGESKKWLGFGRIFLIQKKLFIILPIYFSSPSHFCMTFDLEE